MRKLGRKFGIILLTIFSYSFISNIVYASEPKTSHASINIGQQKVNKLRSQTIAVGKVKPSTQAFAIGDINLPVYECMEEQYVLISDLRQLGCNVEWDPNSRTSVIYDFSKPIKEDIQFEILKEDAIAYLGRGTTYINYQEIPSIFIDGKTLIPIKWLSVFFTGESKALTFTKTEEVSINGINIWFNGDSYVEEPYSFPALKVDEQIYYKDLKYDLDSKYTYVGYVITEINEIVNDEVDLHKTWLKNPVHYTIPAEPKPIEVKSESLDKVFPRNIIKGTMKYATNGLLKGEEVEIQKAEDGISYDVIDKNGKGIRIPFNSVTVKGVPVSKEQATKEQIEQYANEKNLESTTNYLVWTDLYRQRTYILQGSKNNWKLHKSIISSTGRDTTPTPKGLYKLNRRVPYFGKGYMAKNAVAFIGGSYLYHSVIYDTTGRYLLEGRGVLGQKASQGCIRFSPEESLWFYQTMPLGTTVYIN